MISVRFDRACGVVRCIVKAPLSAEHPTCHRRLHDALSGDRPVYKRRFFDVAVLTPEDNV